MKFVSILSILLTFVFCANQLLGQDVQIELGLSQDTILTGNQFIVSYKVSGSQVSDFKAPDLANFNILAGPNISTSMSIINGVVSQEASYQFILQARSPGDFEISPATLIVEGEEYQSDSIQIHILENPNGEIIEDLNQKNSPNRKSKKKRKTYKI